MSPANSIGFPFIELYKVESTNNYAMGLIHAGMAQHGTAVFTHHQTKGKGQRNKQWISNPNENIILSIIVKPFGLKLNELFLLSMSVAIGLQRFFGKYANDQTKIKWPNDIYWRDRKAGGILIENVIQGEEWKYAVIGMGLNINQIDFGDLPAVSLKQVTGKNYNTIEMAKELLDFLQQSFNELASDKTGIIDNYHKDLYKWKEKIHLKNKNENFEGILKGVNPEGMLIVEHRHKEKAFKVGEIEWIR